MSSPSKLGLLSIVSGMSDLKRSTRRLAMLQAYFDESGFPGGQTVFVLGVCVAPVNRWLAFSDEWQSIIDMRPRILYFKAQEAFRREGQFNGISEEKLSEKVTLLARAISDHSDLIFTTIMPEDDFQRNKSGLVRSGEYDPFEYMLLQTISKLLLQLEALKILDKVELIFDRNVMNEAQIYRVWSAWIEKSILKLSTKNRIAGPPLFRDDKDVLPLQAADLIAYVMRYRHLNSALYSERSPLENIIKSRDVSSTPKWYVDLMDESYFEEMKHQALWSTRGYIRGTVGKRIPAPLKGRFVL